MRGKIQQRPKDEHKLKKIRKLHKTEEWREKEMNKHNLKGKNI